MTTNTMIGSLAVEAWRLHHGASADTAIPVVRPSAPILYFGDRDAYQDSDIRVITVGVNPSGEEFRDYPQWLHRPFFEGAQNAPRGNAQNTDPFVFGERFLYTLCRQDSNGRLRRLAPGSLILFGSCKRRAFVLDTAFVVADSVDHTRATYDHVAVPRTNAVFTATTLDPMYAWPNTNGGRLYFSATADAPVGQMFSFVPCLPADERSAFARPEVVLPDLINPTLAMQARTTCFTELDSLTDVWRSVVQQVVTRGLALGVRVDLPASPSRH
jgi:hypothetical protein